MIRLVQCCNRAYAPQGLALFRSLQRHMTGEWAMEWYCLDAGLAVALRRREKTSGSRVWPIIAYDNDVAGVSRDSHARHLARTVDDIAGLRYALNARSGAPWFWTWASQATHHAAENNPGDTICYLDTDTFAFGDLRPAIDEVLAAGADVGMLTHRFPPHRQATHGQRGGWLCGFNVFAPTVRGRAAAAWWAAMVRARCEVHDPGDDYLGIPAGLAGDQAPLHALDRIARVHEIALPGFVASWNADGFNYHEVGGPDDPQLALSDPRDDRAQPLLRFFVGHEYRFDADGNVIARTGYPIPARCQELVVDPWCAAVKAAAAELASA